MRYIGGKNHAGTYQRIINLCPPHRVYVEGFLGSGAILRLKRPAEQSIGIDVDGRLFPALARAAPNLTLLQEDFLEWVRGFRWRRDVLVYLDPPYLPSTRKWRRYYPAEFGEQRHRQLLAWAVRCPAMVMISGYPSELYDGALKGWNREEFTVYTRTHQPRTEVLWMNYDRPRELHDHSFVGINFRERWRITKKIARWTRKLGGLGALERAALFTALVEKMGEGRSDVHQRRE